MSLKKINANIKLIVTAGAKLNSRIHETAVMIAEHALAHNDCTAAGRLVEAMPASMRRTMLVLWFATFTPIVVNATTFKVGMNKPESKKYVPFDIAAGTAKPFYELAEETPEKSYDFDALVKMVEALGKQIEKKIENGKVPANDVAGAQQIARTVQGLRFARPAVVEAAPGAAAANG